MLLINIWLESTFNMFSIIQKRIQKVFNSNWIPSNNSLVCTCYVKGIDDSEGSEVKTHYY